MVVYSGQNKPLVYLLVVLLDFNTNIVKWTNTHIFCQNIGVG